MFMYDENIDNNFEILIASRDPTSPSANQAPGERDIVERMYVCMDVWLFGWFVWWLVVSMVGWRAVGWLVVVWLVGWLVGCWWVRCLLGGLVVSWWAVG